MDNDDLFSSELRGIRDRIAELQGRSRAAPGPGGGLLPEALGELDVAIEELRSQTDELHSTREALEAERHRYQELFESAPVAYLATAPLARIHEGNRAAAGLLGVERGFLAGKPLAACVAGSDRWGFRSMVGRLQRGEDERVSEWSLRFRRRGGEGVTVAVTVEPVLQRDGELRALRWLLRPLAAEETPRTALPAEVAEAQDGARREHLEALEDLDPAGDLDGAGAV